MLRRGVLGVVAILVLAGCGPVGGIGTGPAVEQPLNAPTSAVQSGPLNGTSNSAQIGSGPVKIALIVPLTQGSGPSLVGASLRNAAELALIDSGGNDLTILVKDDQSTPAGARAAAQAAVAEGAELILGPLFAPNVREAASVARPSNKQMIAFSTDTTAASRGVYLLSFLVENYVERIVDFSIARGKKSFAAMIPDNDYGRVAEAQFQSTVAQKGGRVMAIEHYAPGAAASAAQKIAAAAPQIDALFIPDQADAMASVAAALTSAGIDTKRIQMLGTGLWSDARVIKLPALQGAWFAAPETSGFNSFAGRYRAKFNSDPTRIATLAYDATSLAAALARQQGSQRYNGADGVFRFRADGQNERGLSVLQIGGGSTSVVSPAPRSFGSKSGT
jgi:branched-chain amino acid transport system substrate-binding protein